MLENTGIPTVEDVLSVFPPIERLERGPCAIIECFERIPCDPCHTACKRDAMQPFTDINDLPYIITDKCNGCGICVYKCPGLAIMVADMSYSQDKAMLKLPYEFYPLPKEGETVVALDRAGKDVCEAKVVKVLAAPALDKTAVVSLEFDKTHIHDVRNFRFIHDIQEVAVEIEHPDQEDMSIICRCSDLDISTIRDLIAQGYTSVDELKRIARLGMGPCQGRNCIPLVLNELARATGKNVSDLNPGAFRPLTKSMDLGAIADYETNT